MKRTNGQAQSQAPTVNELQSQLQAYSALVARLNLSNRAGLSHQGTRDLYKTLGYPEKIKSSSLIDRWQRQDIARAIVDRPVKATWQGPVGLSESTEEDETELEKAFKSLDQQVNLKSAFMRVDRLSLLGKYAVMLLGFDDSSKETWGLPVTEGERQLKYIRVVSEENAEISTWEDDPANERFGKPRIYNIKLEHPGETKKTTSLKVHHSRIIHVTPDLLENEVEGHSYVETAFNRLMDIEKLVGGSAEMFWRGARPGYAGKTNPDYTIDKDLKEKMQEQISEYENDLRRFMIMEGVDLESLDQQLSDPKGHVEVQIMMLSALTGIPARILMGSERGELASSQDTDHWKEWVQDRRLESAEPGIVRKFVDRMLEIGVLPEVEDEDEGYQVDWQDLFSLGDKDKSEIGERMARALGEYVKSGAEMVMPFEAFLTYVMKMDKDDVKHIMELHEGQLEDMMEEENELERDLDAPPENEAESEPETEEANA